jgi:hypothetical protein
VKIAIVVLVIVILSGMGICLAILWNDIIPPPDYPMVVGTGTTYYIDSAGGSDSNAGTSPSMAWQTVAKVNSVTFKPGDEILFMRGDVWRERIIPQSGEPTGWVMYGAYGIGPDPLFLGSISLNDSSKWQVVGSPNSAGLSTWQWADPLQYDAGNLIFNNTAAVGVKMWQLSDLTVQGDFYCDNSSLLLYLESASNPATFYNGIECALDQHMMYTLSQAYPFQGVANAANIVIENLAFKFGGAYCLKFQDCNHIRVLNCDIEWMGGGAVQGQPQQRYGNGIEFYDRAFYCEAINNTI